MSVKKDCYSPLKIFHHREQIDALRAGLRPDLLHCQLILTNRCNERCNFCAYRAKGYSSSEQFVEADEIPTDKALEIVDDFARLGIKAVELTGGGEPTIHPNFAQICKQLYYHGIQFGVVSNGSNWPKEVFNALGWASWVRVSMDCGRPSTYATIRNSSQQTYHRVRENIRRLKAQNNLVLGVGFVVTKDNWPEIVEAAKNAKEDGVDNFRISAVFQNDGEHYFREFYNQAKVLCKQAKELETDKFTVFDLFGDRIEDLHQQSPSDSFCPIQHLVTYIGADLVVYRCCVLAYNERGALASIKDKSFYDVWQSQYLGWALTSFDARHCPHCMFNAKNATIRYAVNPNPDHVNFL